MLGWKCDEMPAFYSRKSGLAVDHRVESAAEAAAVIRARDELGLSAAVLLTVPVPGEAEIARAELEAILEQALAAADAEDIRGKEITPFLLSRMSSMSGGRTLAANIALLANNARVAALVARELA